MERLKSLDEHIAEMKSFGNLLVPYNYPNVPISDENDINYLKVRNIVVDGYNVVLHYSKSQYDGHYLVTLQVLGKYSPFLPFSLICKIGKKFLGEKYLSLVEIFKDYRKICCWTLVLDQDGNAIEGPYKNDEYGTYEGFEFRRMDPQFVNFY